jgi:hypothetical protein
MAIGNSIDDETGKNISRSNPLPVAVIAAASAVVRTASMLRSTTSGAIAAGAKSVSFVNTGSANATVAGAVLKPTEAVRFTTEGSDTLAAIAYNATGTELLITQVV